MLSAYSPDAYAALPNNYDSEGIYYEGTMGRPIALGPGDDPGFAARLDTALREIVRVRALNMLAKLPKSYGYALCIEAWDRNCPETGASDTSDLHGGYAVNFGIRNQADEPLYMYMLYAAPGVPLRLVAGSHDVGGAALDGLLALTVPFALREWMLARTPFRWGLASAVAALGAYACLTTFSRGVYLAVPVGVLVWAVLSAKNGLPRSARNDGCEFIP